MVEIFEIVCATSWKLRRRSWIRNDEDVKLYLQKTGDMMYISKM
jgi:hypothetical protein